MPTLQELGNYYGAIIAKIRTFCEDNDIDDGSLLHQLLEKFGVERAEYDAYSMKALFTEEIQHDTERSTYMYDHTKHYNKIQNALRPYFDADHNIPDMYRYILDLSGEDPDTICIKAEDVEYNFIHLFHCCYTYDCALSSDQDVTLAKTQSCPTLFTSAEAVEALPHSHKQEGATSQEALEDDAPTTSTSSATMSKKRQSSKDTGKKSPWNNSTRINRA